MFNPCIQQLTPVDFNAFITPSLTTSWWKRSYTHITLTGVEYEDNGFTYYYNTVYIYYLYFFLYNNNNNNNKTKKKKEERRRRYDDDKNKNNKQHFRFTNFLLLVAN